MSVPESLINSLYRAGTLTHKDIQSIVTSFQSVPKQVDEDVDIELIVYDPEVRERIQDFTLNPGPVAAALAQTRQRDDMRGCIRQLPNQVKAYPLDSTITGTAQLSNTLRQFSGGAVFDGSSYITVSNHARLNPTDDITIAGWFYFTDADTIRSVLEKPNQYDLVVGRDQIQFRMYIASTSYLTTIPITENAWHYILMSYDGSNLKRMVNATENNLSITGSIDTGSSDFTIGTGASGAVVNGTLMSNLTIIHNGVSASWITDHKAGVLDTSGANEEILTYKFATGWHPTPDASVGLCQIN